MSAPEHRILDKLKKLLAQAEGTDNEHEADAFLSQAQAMASRHSIDLALARRALAKTQKREQPTQRTIPIGEARSLGNARFVNLFLAVASNNDCKTNIASNSTFLVAYGFPSDIEVAETLYMHLAVQMAEAAKAFLAAGDWRGEKTWDPRRGWVAVNAKAARLTFYDAFIDRIAARLTAARQQAEAQAEADLQAEREAHSQAGRDASAPSAALVLADKRAEVNDFYKSTSNARGSWGGSRAVGASSSARRAGRRAGDAARLHPTQAMPSSRKQLPPTD